MYVFFTDLLFIWHRHSYRHSVCRGACQSFHCSGRQVNDDIWIWTEWLQSPAIGTPREWAGIVDHNLDRSDICSFSIFARPRPRHGDSLTVFRSIWGHRGSHLAAVKFAAVCEFRPRKVVLRSISGQLLRRWLLSILSRRRRRIVLCNFRIVLLLGRMYGAKTTSCA